MSRRPLVAGNWKLNGRADMARALVSDVVARRPADVDVVLCPPFPYLALVKELAGDGVGVGAQTLSDQQEGAFTGEVAAGMIADLGCQYVIVGHSERRSLFGEDNDMVAARFQVAAESGLTPILCVGETLEQREAGETEAVVAAQLDAVLDRVGIAAFAQAIVAYEPVWAIGTGLTATPEQAQEVHAFIRERLGGLDHTVADAIRLLYGGSVKADNAASLFAAPDIDGGLIGGASLDSDSFVAICEAAGN